MDFLIFWNMCSLNFASLVIGVAVQFLIVCPYAQLVPSRVGFTESQFHTCLQSLRMSLTQPEVILFN